MAPCPLNLKEFKISFSQVKLVSKVEFNFGWHTWKLHYQNCSTLSAPGTQGWGMTLNSSLSSLKHM